VDFDAFVAARGQALLRLAHVLTGDPDDAQDLSQATLVDTLRHWRKVARADSPDAYVRRMMLNRHLATRRLRRSGEVVLRDVTPSADASVADPATGVADRDEVHAALATLSPRARAVLVLRYYADLDDAAIGDCLGMPVGTVRSLVSRSLATLRSQVADTARRPARSEETR
jgi:RNA polymerase sigma-70 factor (sigma-E family)